MPQLDFVTFMSQYFWLCIIFGGFYLCLAHSILPALASLAKTREALCSSEAPAVATALESVNYGNLFTSQVKKAVADSYKRFVAFHLLKDKYLRQEHFVNEYNSTLAKTWGEVTASTIHAGAMSPSRAGGESKALVAKSMVKVTRDRKQILKGKRAK